MCTSVVNTNSALYMIGTDNWNFSVVKVNYNGSIEWGRSYGGSEHEVCLNGRATSDGGLILAGATESYGAGSEDVWLLKLDGEGNQEWSSYFGTSNKERAQSVDQTSDGGYIAVGTCYISYDNTDALDLYTYMVKTDSEGNLEWEKTFRGDHENGGNSVIETSDSCYIFTGSIDFVEPVSWKLLLVKTDSNGDIVWENYYDNTDNCVGYCVIEASDGGFVAVGLVDGGSSDYEVYVLKTDSAGNELWSQTFGGNTWYNCGECVIEAFEGGYTVSGTIWDQATQATPECFVRKIDQNGNTEWHCIVDGSTYGEHGNGLVQLSDGGYVVGGYMSTDSISGDDSFIARLSPPEGIEDEGAGQHLNVAISSISPNPLQSSTEISLFLQETSDVEISIIDLSGRRVTDIQTGLLPSGETTLIWNGTNSSHSSVSTGIYILRVCSQGIELTEKLAVLR